MEKKTNKMMMSKLDCCPELAKTPVCDKLSFRYRLPFRPRVGNDNGQTVPVEVVLHFRLERCSGDLVLGDPIYSITMMPGEKVRLFTSDRHSRWSYDSASSLSYRHETTSEESYYSAAMSSAISDLTINQSGSSSSYFDESWSEGGGGVNFSLFGLSIGGGGGGGSYDAQSASSFASSLSQHSFAASSYVAAGVRAKSATAIGEVQQRQHAEGESEAHYESSSRVFRNPNRCQAVTYMFHKVNKIQHVKFRLVAIERRVDDPAAPTGAHQRGALDTTGRVKVLPEVVRATDKKRLDIERMGRTSAFEQQQAETSAVGSIGVNTAFRGNFATTAISTVAAPIHVDLRTAALRAVDQDLVKAGMLDEKTGKPSSKIIAELSWERQEVLPTPGVVVKGCLDDCPTCEPALQKEIELDLLRKKLKNELLKKRIDLLEKSQEYRCCPEDSEEDEG